MLKTGGSTKREPILLMIKDVTQNDTRSGRSERTISIRCNSLHEFSHSPEKMEIFALNITTSLQLNTLSITMINTATHWMMYYYNIY